MTSSAKQRESAPPFFDKQAFQETIKSSLIVSRETQERLLFFAERLVAYTAHHNLIAKSTIPFLASRHVLDSAQLCSFVPSTAECVVDLGSGAGFPGIVLSLLGVKNVHLIESIGKKARFLISCAQDLSLDVIVHHARIEDVKNIQADIVTARALTSLSGLISYAVPLLKKDGACLFLKGENYKAELTEAQKYWTFDLEFHKSTTHAESVILVLRNIKPVNRHDSKK